VFGAKAQPASFLGDFCNKIGTKQTYRAVCYWSALGGKADVSQRFATIAIMSTRPSMRTTLAQYRDDRMTASAV